VVAVSYTVEHKVWGLMWAGTQGLRLSLQCSVCQCLWVQFITVCNWLNSWMSCSWKTNAGWWLCWPPALGSTQQCLRERQMSLHLCQQSQKSICACAGLRCCEKAEAWLYWIVYTSVLRLPDPQCTLCSTMQQQNIAEQWLPSLNKLKCSVVITQCETIPCKLTQG